MRLRHLSLLLLFMPLLNLIKLTSSFLPTTLLNPFSLKLLPPGTRHYVSRHYSVYLSPGESPRTSPNWSPIFSLDLNETSTLSTPPALYSFPDPKDWTLIIDCRSPSEFAEDNIPNSINLPSLNDTERISVGTIYKQTSAFEARRLGASYVSSNIATHLSKQPLSTLPHDSRILVYCWRGGDRSSSLATVLNKVGWHVTVLKGGYKSYRENVRRALNESPIFAKLNIHIVAGSTGVGKGKLLTAIEELGGQIIDLEVLANHKGSALGDNPSSVQPSQKAFEAKLVFLANTLDEKNPTFVEAEGSRVGKLQVPLSLFTNMAKPSYGATVLNLNLFNRVRHIRDDYSHFESTHVPELKTSLKKLTRQHGVDKVAKWCCLADSGEFDQLVKELLVDHYDAAYAKSRQRDFEGIDEHDEGVELGEGRGKDYRRVASELMERLEREGVGGE